MLTPQCFSQGSTADRLEDARQYISPVALPFLPLCCCNHPSSPLASTACTPRPPFRRSLPPAWIIPSFPLLRRPP